MRITDELDPLLAELGESPYPTQGGHDGLNLVEFPLSVLSNKAPSDVKTLEFCERRKDKGQLVERQVTITGSDKYGLPTFRHHEVLVGLIQLTWEKNAFDSHSPPDDPRVEFSRYELLKLLGWRHTGPNYRLIEDAIDVWLGTTIKFKDAWWVDGDWKSRTFNILDDAQFFGNKGGGPKKRSRSQLQEEPSYVIWASVPFEDFKQKRTKGLDFNFYKSLDSSVSKQLYRYLDKWFHYGGVHRYPDFRMFACEKIGLSRKCSNSDLKRSLDKAVAELAGLGYLADQGREQRYLPSGEVVFYRAKKRKQAVPKTAVVDAEQQQLVAELKKRGLKNSTPDDLARQFDKAAIKAAIENYDDRLENDEDVGPGFLVSAIKSKDGFGYRKGYRPKAERELASKLVKEKKAAREEVEERKKALDEAIGKLPFDSYRQLSAVHQEVIRSEAVSQALPFVKHQLCKAEQGGDEVNAQRYTQTAIERHFKQVEKGVSSEEDSRAAAVAWVRIVSDSKREIGQSDEYRDYVAARKKFDEADEALKGILATA